MRIFCPFFLMIFFCFFGFQTYSQKKQSPKNGTPAVFSYKTEWTTIQKFLADDKPKSARERMKNVLEHARIDKNEPQMVKAIMGIVFCNSKIEEDEDSINLALYKKEISSALPLEKAILENLLAKRYAEIYSHDSWKIDEREVVANQENTTDYKLWDKARFHKEILYWAKLSLSDKELLQKTPVGEFKAIMDTSKTETVFRPALYDVLVHNVLENIALENGDDNLFIKDSISVMDYKTFLILPIDKQKWYSDQDMAVFMIKMYQDLELFHANDKNPQAFGMVDMERMKFIYEKSRNESKEKDFITGLKSIETSFAENEIAAEAGFERAILVRVGTKSDAIPGINNRQAALDICNFYIQKFPASLGGKNCQLLKDEILEKTLSVSVSKTTLPSKAIKITLNYQNTNKIWYRIVSISQDELGLENKQGLSSELRLKKYVSMPVLHKGDFELPLPMDYNKHNIDLALPKLDFGNYIILVSRFQNFDVEKGTVYADIIVSNLKAYVQSKLDSSKARFYVLDAENGASISGADVMVQLQNYSGNHKWIKGKTNEAGYIELDSLGINSYYMSYYQIISGKDILTYDNLYFNNRNYYEPSEKSTITKYFTDRAIYRPGQTVHFKGIAYKSENNNRKTEVLSDSRFTVFLVDENDEELDSIKVTTNSFGSFSGSFILPKSVLNGKFTIDDVHGLVEFNVEEYKRPKFEIIYQPKYKTYRINDTIYVAGDVMNYSGSALGNVSVAYSVKSSNTRTREQIKSGKVFTDEKGHFKFGFKAIPFSNTYGYGDDVDNSVYRYDIEATISDITGETHSASTEIKVAKQALKTRLVVNNWVDSKQNITIHNSVENQNNEPVAGKGTLEIFKMAEPGLATWDMTENINDQHYYDSARFHQFFPNEVYSDENLVKKVEKRIGSFSVPANETFTLDPSLSKSLAQGHYQAVFTIKDTFGNIIKTNADFKVYNPEDTKPAINNPAYFIGASNEIYKVGDKMQFVWGSANKAIGHIVVEHDGKIVFEKTILADHQQIAFEIPVLESYRGGLKIMVFTSIQNHTWNQTVNIQIPFLSKELDIKTTVFHSSLIPGQKEIWKIKIKGPDAKKVSAELMATLYDASLDAYKVLDWGFYVNPYLYNHLSIEPINRDGNWNFINPFYSYISVSYLYHIFPMINEISKKAGYNSGIYSKKDFNNTTLRGVNGMVSISGGVQTMDRGKGNRTGGRKYIVDGIPVGSGAKNLPKSSISSIEVITDGLPAEYGEISVGISKNPIIPRKNLNELAFFFPQLSTNDSGEVEISFTMPEALTRWHFKALAHTKDLMTGLLTKDVVTRKQLMVQPNPPRFVREGDIINFTTKVSNMNESGQDVKVLLQIYNPANDKEEVKDIWLDNNTRAQRIHIDALQSKAVSWSLKIPKGMEGFLYRITAANNQFSDGEEGVIPVLPARIMVTESMPLFVRGNQTKEYSFDDLVKYKSSSSLTPYRLSMEMTSNPAWYAIKALPYLQEFPHECNEQLFERVFANTIASYILHKEPKIKETFKKWQKDSCRVLQAQLEQNPDLKNILLAETPWVQDAQDEKSRNKRMAELFDDSIVKKGLNDAISKLEKNQLADGSWPWFPGMEGSRYITNIICIGIGRLEDMKTYTEYTDRLRAIGAKAFVYLDNQMKKDYDQIVKNKEKLSDDHLTSDIVDYLYARTFWKVTMDIPYERPLYFWLEQSFNHWQNRNLMEKAMLVSALVRQDEEPQARKIWNSIDEYALHTDEMGRYWKENTGGFGHNQQQVETQCMLIEAYSSLVRTNTQPIEEMKIWLLKNKQTHNWPTTIATADAIYCLLLKGKETIADDKEARLTMGTMVFDAKSASRPEAGTGYFSHTWNADSIKPELGTIKLEKKDDGIAWGDVQFQFYQDLDKIKGASGPIAIKKEILIQDNSAGGEPKFITYNPRSKTMIQIGDLVKIRIQIKLDRDMEYIHLKDLRAAAFEPVDHLSGYQYQQGLGYYQDIKDASMNFFIDHIAKGTYVFEYSLRATQTGEFQNGIATIENMYAPEFKSHSDGVVVKVR